MKLISNLDHLIANINTVECYLTEGNDNQQLEISNLIRRGKCLIAYRVKNETRFAPSRFLGYLNNRLEGYDRSAVDGRETNVVINKILGFRPLPNPILKKKFLSYCDNLGLKADNKNHTFWELNLNNEFQSNDELSGEFPEGRIIERKHVVRERNPIIISIVKANFKKKHGRLFCQACNFDFEKIYGPIGKNFIEAHHTIPISEMKPGDKTKPEDIALLCSNCHKMVHKKRPWLSMEKLSSVIKKK